MHHGRISIFGRSIYPWSLASVGFWTWEFWQALVPLQSKSHGPYNLALLQVDVPSQSEWQDFLSAQFAFKLRQEEVPLQSKFHEPDNLALRQVDVPSHCKWQDILSAQFAFKWRHEEVSQHLIDSTLVCISHSNDSHQCPILAAHTDIIAA